MRWEGDVFVRVVFGVICVVVVRMRVGGRVGGKERERMGWERVWEDGVGGGETGALEEAAGVEEVRGCGVVSGG